LFHPLAQLIEQRPGPRLANTQPDINRLAADLVFDRIESADPGQCIGSGWRSMRQVDVVELAPGMCPAGCLIYMVAVEMMEASIGIGLQSSSEVLQVLPRMFSPAVFRIGEPDSGRSLFACRPVVAHICPEPSCLGLAVAGREHRHRRVVGMELATGEDMLADGVNQRSE